jgi:tetratricopeptide (TPR) repeat protein
VAVLLAATPAGAQTLRELWHSCEGKDSASSDLIISSCTTLINSGREMQNALGQAFNNRCIAYRAKGELDRALEDCDRAVDLNPGYSNVYNSRGNVYREKGD